MPIEKVHRDTDRAWALWHIVEDERSLLTGLPEEMIPDLLTNPNKRLEYIAGRLLVSHLLRELGAKYSGIRKDEFGKPFPVGVNYELSLSHSFPYVAALVDSSIPVGIDLEQPKAKLLKIAHRVLSAAELANVGDDVVKHCVYWCAKEAMIKIYGKKDLTLAENLLVTPFELSNDGNIVGKIIVRGEETTVPLRYSVHKDFVVVMNTR